MSVRTARLVTGALVIGGVAAGIASLPRLAMLSLRPPLRPIPVMPDDLGLPFEETWLRSASGTSLHAWFVPVVGVAPAVAVMHGWTANAGLMLPLAEPLREAGFHVLLMDGRGHGLSERDELTGAVQFSEDIEAGVDWLKADPRVSSIGVLGHSAGGTAAILAAARRPEIRAVVAVSSVADPRLIRWGRIPNAMQQPLLALFSKRTGYPVEEMIALNRIAHVDVPMLLIHGGLDVVVPAEHTRLLAAAASNAQLLIVDEADHGTLESFAPAVPVVGEFLDLSLRAPARL